MSASARSHNRAPNCGSATAGCRGGRGVCLSNQTLVTGGRMLVDHPEVGAVELAFERLIVPSAPGQHLVVYTADPGSPAESALRALSASAIRSRAASRSPATSG